MISAVQLLFLIKWLPKDEDAMEAELASYAQKAISGQSAKVDDDEAILSIEDRIASFDGRAAKQTILYVQEGLKELSEELNPFRICGDDASASDDEKDDSIRDDGAASVTNTDACISEKTTLLV
jgi:hypothetical protein